MKETKRKNNTSGESPADSDDELGEIFEKLPDMNPVFLIESKASKRPSPDQSTSGSSDVVNCKKKRTLSPTPDHTDALEGKGKKKSRRSVDMKTFFTEAIEKKEGAIERRHKEKINTINSLVGVLKDLVKK
ncbi:uncharacterized protein LOC134236510 [Saccostrea cucullata]|uniref:uncharacterized protein LOC134236510 n=1 Tax=Saccostrea cuccullata TaxID=36930 RepID=UPI002ED20B02